MPASNVSGRFILSLRRICRSYFWMSAKRSERNARKQKKPRKNPGLFKSWEETLRLAARQGPRAGGRIIRKPYRPKRGRSPLRSEARAEAASARSIAASRRLNREVVGA